MVTILIKFVTRGLPPELEDTAIIKNARINLRLKVKYARRWARSAIGSCYVRMNRPRRPSDYLPPQDISSVLICRINRRLGNTLFLTPAIQALHEMLPHASIDLVLGHPQAAELLSNLPGVRRTIVIPQKLSAARGFFKALRAMRATRYDLVIDPVPESTSGRIALTLARARNRLGFVNASQWAPLTHAVVDAPEIAAAHEAERAVLLMSRIFRLGYDPQRVRLWLPIDPKETQRGHRLIANAVQGKRKSQQKHVFGYYSHAANFKVIDTAWWRRFWDAFLVLEPGALPLEFLSLSRTEPLDARFPALVLPSLRDLAATVSATRMFISTDTGPMHLASSTSVPTVALFHASNPDLYRPLKPTDLAIDLSSCCPVTAAQRCHHIWRDQPPQCGALQAAH
jgi:heptosyltransferase-3